MIRPMIATAIAIVAIAAPAAAEKPSGTYTKGTNAPMSFICPAYDDCTGYYEGNRSWVRLKGSPSGLFVGLWIEPFTIRTCDTTVEKSPHWGRVVLKFGETACSWTGKWGYCDDEPSHEWVGSR